MGLLNIYLTRFGLSFSPPSEAGVQIRQWFKSPAYGIPVFMNDMMIMVHKPNYTDLPLKRIKPLH
jgi:hypothetical protein